MTSKASETVEVVSIHIPPAVQRSPGTCVDVASPGGIRFRAVASRRRGGSLGVTLPLTRDGEQALFLSDDMHQRVEAAVLAAVQSDPAARDHLGRSAAEHHGRFG